VSQNGKKKKKGNRSAEVLKKEKGKRNVVGLFNSSDVQETGRRREGKNPGPEKGESVAIDLPHLA